MYSAVYGTLVFDDIYNRVHSLSIYFLFLQLQILQFWADQFGFYATLLPTLA
jgi:hypothetical protein